MEQNQKGPDPMQPIIYHFYRNLTGKHFVTIGFYGQSYGQVWGQESYRIMNRTRSSVGRFRQVPLAECAYSYKEFHVRCLGICLISKVGVQQVPITITRQSVTFVYVCKSRKGDPFQIHKTNPFIVHTPSRITGQEHYGVGTIPILAVLVPQNMARKPDAP